MTRTRIFKIGMAAIVAACLGNRSQSLLFAQEDSSVKSGVYSAEQAERGAELYAKACASCHGAKLEGRNQAPPLAGAEFAMNWDGQPLSDLFEKIQTSMPADKPGSLSAKETVDVIALMLREGGLPTGASELPADTERLKHIRFEAGK